MTEIGKGMDNSALAKKIRELLKRKEDSHNELKKVEDMLQKEDEEIRNELEKTVRDIREQDHEKFKDEQKTKMQEDPSLEQAVEEEHPQKAPDSQSQFGYSSITSSDLQGNNVNVYDLAKQDVYDKVVGIMNTPAQFRTGEERNFLQGVTYQIGRIQRENMYINQKDPNDFMKRAQNVIGFTYK